MELKQEKLAHKVVLKNLKAVAFNEAMIYLKEKSEILSNLLTNQHRSTIKQFIAYKKRTQIRAEILNSSKQLARAF